MIRGKKVFLRPLEKNDVDVLYDIWCDEEVRKYDGLYSTMPLKSTILKNFTAFMFSHKKYLTILNEEKIIIGCITYEEIMDLTSTYVIGITLGKEFWNKGYGEDAIKAVLKYLFINKMAHRIELEVAALNTAAIRCYEKCGFENEGRKRQRYFYKGQYADIVIMGILKEEYIKTNNTSIN